MKIRLGRTRPFNLAAALVAGRYASKRYVGDGVYAVEFVRLEDTVTALQGWRVILWARQISEWAPGDVFPIAEALVARAKGWS